MKTFTFILMVCLFLTLPGKGQNVGDKAPDFMLQQLQGGNFTLSEHFGSVVFIFWLGYACPFCQSAAPSVNSEIINTFKNRSGFLAIGVDTWDGSSSQVQAFKSHTGLDINYLMKGSSVAQGWKTTYDRLVVVDKSGKIVFKGTQGTSSDIGKAKTAIENALIVTSSTLLPDLDGNLFVTYPNPFNTQTTIHFQLNKYSLVSLNVFDISGKKVRELANEKFPAGEKIIRFSKGNLKNGIYFLRLRNEEQVTTRKIIIQQ